MDLSHNNTVVPALLAALALNGVPLCHAGPDVDFVETRHASAQPNPPINIEADKFTVYLADEKAIWEGNVVASQGNYTFRSGNLTLHLEHMADADEANDQGDKDTTPAPRQAVSLSARSLNYQLDKGKVVGEGDSELRRGEEVIRANQITYLVADRIALGIPEPHGRVSVQFFGNPNRPVIPGSLGRTSRGAE